MGIINGASMKNITATSCILFLHCNAYCERSINDWNSDISTEVHPSLFTGDINVNYCKLQ